MPEQHCSGGSRDDPPDGHERPTAGGEFAAKLLLSALDGASEAVVVLDPSLRIIFANRLFHESFSDLAGRIVPGASYQELLGCVLEDDSGSVLRDAIDQLKGCGLDSELRPSSGQWLSIRSVRLVGDCYAVYHARPTEKSGRSNVGDGDNLDPLRDVIAFMDQGVLTTAPDDTFQLSNDRVAEILEIPRHLIAPGAPRRAMVEYRTSRGDYRHDGFTDSGQVMEAFAPGRQSKMEITTPSGRIVRTDASPLPSGGTVFTYTDVTRLRRHEAITEEHKRDLGEREAELAKLARKLDIAGHDNWALLSRFEAIIDNIDYAVVFMDGDLRVEIANRAWRVMWGIDEDEPLADCSLVDLMNKKRRNGVYDVEDNDWQTYVAQRIAAVRRGSVSPTEIRRRDGTVLRYQCVALSDGRRMLTYFDITDLKNREAELRHNSEALEVIFNNVRQGLTWFDADLNLRAFNAKALETLDIDEGTLSIGDSLETLIRINVERGEHGAGEVDPIVQERLEIARRLEPNALERQRHDGRRIRIERYPVSEGGFVAVYTDVTRQHEHELELEAEKERANTASQAKSAFLANMSHEIRTPLNSIIGMAELLQTTPVDDRQRRFAQTIVSSSNGLLAIINDILDFSKIEAGELTLDPEPFDMRSAIEDVATMLASQTTGKNVEILVRYKPGTPRHVVSDKGRIRQIVTNLVGNAVKFTETGHVLIDVKGGHVDGKADLKISVIDTGIGIPADKHDAIFGAFQQVDGSSTRRHGGTGLGLAITKRIVETLGGNIGLDSDVGCGSTFWFSVALPMASDDEHAGQRPPDGVTDLPVLIVDDRPMNRLILEEQINHWGAQPTPVDSGLRALRALQEALKDGTPFRLAVVNETLPDMDATTFVHHVRGIEGASDMPIIAVTSISKGEAWNRLQALGISGLLEKPVKADLLLETIGASIAGRPQPTVAQSDHQAPSIADSAQWTVLVAEDHEMNRRLVEHMLYGSDFRPVFAENGEVAVQLYRETQPDLVLMDVSMPKMDGYEATARIREIQQHTGSTVPIIGVTAHAFEEDKRRCIQSGMDDHLPKPLGLEALRNALEHWIHNRQPHAKQIATLQ